MTQRDLPAPPEGYEWLQGPGRPMRCLHCGGRTEEYCGPVVHHQDCKLYVYVAPDPNARKLTQDEIDSLLGFDANPDRPLRRSAAHVPERRTKKGRK